MVRLSGILGGLRGGRRGLLPFPERVPGAGAGRALRVAVSGGGPVGLALAITLKDLMGDRVEVTVRDKRWAATGGGVAWMGPEDGNRRRTQVVTLQSRVWSALPGVAREALFPAGGFSETWPLGRDSPVELGRPRNVRIADAEDRLLAVASTLGVAMVAGTFDPSGDHGADLVAVCEGTRSPTRERLAHRFGKPDPSVFSLGGRHVEDLVLGLGVKASIDPAAAVALTVSQRRFLLNAHAGEGLLNVRLLPGEADEIVPRDPVTGAACRCGARRTLEADGSGAFPSFRCPADGAAILPRAAALGRLWPRVRSGLAMFGIDEADVSSLSLYRCSMVQMARFTAELAPGDAGGASFACLLGDAANAIHVWPGRGMNHGILSAVSLARTLDLAWSGSGLRHSDLMRHEANMHLVQYRHKHRAWLAMVQREASGEDRTIVSLMADGLRRGGGRRELVDAMRPRFDAIIARLGGRMDALPVTDALVARLAAVDDESLRMIVASGPWETRRSGGEEVSIDHLLPQARRG